MREFTENESKLLDHILTLALKNGFVNDDLLLESADNFIDLFPEVKSGDYSYYLSTINYEGLGEVHRYNANHFRIEPIAEETERFIKNGGFRKQFDLQKGKNKKHEEVENLTFEKLKYDVKNSKRMSKTYWWTFSFALIALLISIYNFIKGFL
ncbi:hypothetical protein BZG01_15880 [Labilibaculum manganireducens]|uniref:Uncharacterized protein n=1 Tax=Labilibaculum manganireducens TaxID=1940525 RepID=A0A2N3HZ25_9BACT|nr:hypothetical protein [Labilibaculum manganireducens]PKQ63304.1 hypothetical protein BZG01_15880 [Labilibaculum manganireducens]